MTTFVGCQKHKIPDGKLMSCSENSVALLSVCDWQSSSAQLADTLLAPKLLALY